MRRDMKKNKILIPTSIGWTSPRDVQVVPGAQPTRCSRKREKGLNGAGLHFHPLPLAGEGRVRVFFL
jgi:hypothetical protein